MKRAFSGTARSSLAAGVVATPRTSSPGLASLCCARVPGQGVGAVHEGEERLPATSRDESELLRRITVNPRIFGGKPILRGRRLGVEHVLGMLAAGDSVESILKGYAWLEAEDVQACLVYARRIVANERIEPLLIEQS